MTVFFDPIAWKTPYSNLRTLAYSDRSATSGSIRVARSAGMSAAVVVTPASTTATTANVVGSRGTTPNSSASR